MTREQVEAVLDSMEANARRGIPPWVHDAPRNIDGLLVAYHDDTDSYDVAIAAPCGVNLAKARDIHRAEFWPAVERLQAAVMETA